jgi:hypothetical protein
MLKPPVTNPNLKYSRNRSVKPLSMIPTSEFINPETRDKLNKKKIIQKGLYIERNQNLGNYTTGSVSAIKLCIIDAAYVDGDLIRVF